MIRSNRQTLTSIAALSAILVTGMIVTACKDDYLNRDDTVIRSAGSAMRGNAAIHTIDPWPPGARKTQQNTDATKARNAVEVYRRVPPAPKQSATSVTTQ